MLQNPAKFPNDILTDDFLSVLMLIISFHFCMNLRVQIIAEMTLFLKAFLMVITSTFSN